MHLSYSILLSWFLTQCTPTYFHNFILFIGLVSFISPISLPFISSIFYHPLYFFTTALLAFPLGCLSLPYTLSTTFILLNQLTFIFFLPIQCSTIVCHVHCFLLSSLLLKSSARSQTQFYPSIPLWFCLGLFSRCCTASSCVPCSMRNLLEFSLAQNSCQLVRSSAFSSL